MYNTPKRFAGIKRFREILGVLSKHGLGYVLESCHLKKRSFFHGKKETRPVELRVLFEELGGIYIKLGQFLSLRPDLVPKEYCDSLSELQDSVEPIPFEEVEFVLKSELKKPISQLFKSFEKKPIASASIGQVHKAVLKDRKVVAVKVMRPGIRSLFETDLEILDYLARQIKHYMRPTIFNPEDIFEEFRRYTENELDFLKEARNIKLVHDSFKDDNIVTVPDVVDNLTTTKVLTMTFIEGIELRRIIAEPGKYKSLDRKKIARQISNCFMKQIFLDGFFHGDPHPGNILVTRRGIALLDFGIVGRLNDDLKEKFGFLLVRLIEKDPCGVAESFISLNVADAAIDVNAFERDISDLLSEYYDVSVENINIASLFFNALGVARKYKLRVPAEFVTLGKSLVTLKSVAEELDPSYNLVDNARPFMKKLLVHKKKNIIKTIASESRRFYEFLHSLPDTSKKFYSTLSKADLALDTINEDISALTREVRVETMRLVIGIIIAAFIISATFAYPTTPKLSKLFLVAAFLLLLYIIFGRVIDSFKRQ